MPDLHDLHMLAAAYALDALDEFERRAFERHLAGCETCTAELREFTEAAAALADRVAEPAPAALHDRVLAEVRMTRQLPARSARPVRGPSWRRSLIGAAAAVLVAAGAALGTVAYQEHQSAEQARNLADGITRVLTSPDRVEVEHTVTGGGRATMVMAGGDAVLSTAGIAEAPSGHEYQTWVIGADGVIQSGGKLDLDKGEAAAFMKGVAKNAALAVTIEPEGGSQQPTTAPVVRLAAS
jgi:anti-sigma-K factor RskA